ncbi:hypothetical protein [Halioxenophilus aromaticivorans]|uniref:Uncharacterized protein n=1 Tax=Halioxenophilus aromaticivorans TaxID=1306992 RepID=A0AAV3U9G8_9ALTE
MVGINKFIINALIVFAVALPMMSVARADMQFDFAKSTPVGSWQVREEITTNHKGKQELTVIKTSLLSKTEYNGAPHYWVEMEMASYKLKNDKRKAKGKPVVMKALVDASVANGEVANVMGNINKYGREIIFQTGDDAPIRIEQSGLIGQTMLQSLGTKVSYQFSKVGEQSLKVPAGTIACTAYQGTGSTEINIVIKKIRVDSDNETCLSDKIPFGVVQAVADMTSNGKPSKTESVLIEYGKSGAVSKITQEPKSM